MSPILDGVRVIDFTQYLAGPTVTRLLAEMGADIVKIELPPYGDPSRFYAIVKNGRSGYFIQQNRGKKSLCLDIDHPDGRRILDDLLSTADVFVENTGPGVLDKRGLDYASLRDRCPRLIMASVSGFGRDSAMSDRPAFDVIAQAQSGIMHMTGPPDGPPSIVGCSIGDVGAGVHAAAAIGFALFHRERTGEGQHVDISMVDSLFHMHELSVQGPPLTGMRWQPTRSGHRSAVNAPLGAFRGPEGWLVIQAMDRQWAGVARAMGRPELIDDERFGSIKGRQQHRDALNALLEDWLATFPTDDAALAALDAERVPCTKVIAPVDAIGHPHYESRGMIRRVHDPVIGEVVVPGPPLRFSAQPEVLDAPAPLLGQHNAEILTALGYDDAAIAGLAEAGVIASGPT